MNSPLSFPQPLPMFYRELVALDPAKHLGMGVRGSCSLAAARQANAVPLGVSEFADASQYCPVVFGPAGNAAFPVMVTALVEGRNLFVDDEGQWSPGVYLPGWLRRYPFWMQPDAAGQNASIWFDPQAGKVVPLQDDAQALPLFDWQGGANHALEQIVAFCRLCMEDSWRTAAFMKALEERNLLVTRQASMELAPGQNYTLGGFRVVDMEAYHRLPDAVLAQWVRNGWAALVALHWISMQRGWPQLLQRHREIFHGH